MKRLTDIIAITLSVVLHPLFVPTYGVVLFCCAIMQDEPSSIGWMPSIIGSTATVTCLLPLTIILLQYHNGTVSDLQLSNRAERKASYISCLAGYCVWTVLLWLLQDVPLFLAIIAVGATAALLIVMTVNRWWKISAHLTGMGGFIGGVLSYLLYTGAMPGPALIITGIVLTLLLMYARIHLRAHTPEQVCAGWLLGLTCTTLPIYIYYHAA